jgi:hypothetical protein
MHVKQKKDIKTVAMLCIGTLSGGFLMGAVLAWLR